MAAANSIFKLKVETSEYDQKLANAAKGIRHLADVAHQSGGELTGLEKSELDYIRALGEMETKSRSASGQVRELSSTYKELKVVYDQLNEVEKADEGGKALAASLETLKQRAQEAKSQLDTATQSLQSNSEAGQGTSGIMEVLKEKFTVNIDALKLFNAGLTASKAALDVAKDAFFASESTVDEWGRILDSSKSLYEGFLTALNTGDISGYLGRIDEIVQAARTAYNELDRLGTMKTIQAPQMSAQQTENERMRMMIQTGRYIAPVDGRKASMKDGQLLTPEQIHRLETQLQNGMKTVVSLVGNEVKQTGKAIDAVYNRQAKELGMSLSEFRKGTSSMAEFDKRMAGYEQYQKWRSENYYTDNWGNRRVKEGNPYQEYSKWGTFRVDGERYNDLVRLIQQRDQQAAQAYGMQSQAYRTMNRAEGITVSKLMKGETAGGTTTHMTTAHTSSPQQRAEEQVESALSKYNDAIDLATKQMEAGNITEAEFKNQMLSQQQRLYDAYGQAYRTYTDPKYKDAQQKAADEIVRLGGEVKTATEAQKKTQESARQLEQAQKELAKYEAEAAAALQRNDLTSYYAATSKVEASKAKIAQMTTPVTSAREDELAKSRKLQSIKLAPKEFTISANDEDALAKVRKIQGVTIKPKEFSVTAETDDAKAKLREVMGEQMPDKAFTITANDESLPMLQAIEGVNIAPKEFSVTADTDEAMTKLREVIGEQIPNKAFTITATDEALPLLQSIEGVTITPKEFVITADDEDALAKVQKIQGVKLSPKVFTITTTDEEALAKVSKIQGVKLTQKEFVISADDEDALAKVRKIQGVSIAPKEFSVTATTDDALSQLREIVGAEISDKDFTISATDESLPLLQAIEGVTITPKEFSVTADTDEAMTKLREVIGEQIPNKAFTITANDEALLLLQSIEGITITPKEFTITADDEDALAKVQKIQGVKLSPKEFTITATDEEALAKVSKIQGVKLSPKDFTISTDNEEALAKVQKIQGVKLSPKEFTITATDEEALAKVRKILGVKLAPKEFTISADDEDALAKVRKIQGVAINPKEFSVTATTDDAMAKLREVVGAEIGDKDFIVSANDESLPLLQAIEGLSIQPKTFSVTAETADALSQLREVVGAEIGDKDFTISATDESLPLLQAIEGITITPKEFCVTATTDDAMTKLREVMGSEIDGKDFTISATDESLPLLQAIEGIVIAPKEFVVTANTEQAHEAIKKLDALSEQTEESLAKARKPHGQQNATTPNFSLTQNNLQGFISNIQKQMGDTSLTIDLFGDLTSQLNDAKMLSSAIQTALKNGLNPAALGLDNIWKQVFNINPGDYIDDSQWEELRTKMEAIIGKPIEINFQTGEMKSLNNDAKTTEKSFREAASAVSSVSSALQQLEDPSAKIAGIIGQAVANIALGFAQATASDSKLGVFGWIAAITGGLATMVSTISAIHNATGYAQGGIVKGSTYSGDRVQGLVDGVTPVGLNAGEVVLNHSQQATLAAELTNRDNGGATSSRPYVDAETIYLGVNNYLKRSGRGEIVTSKNK